MALAVTFLTPAVGAALVFEFPGPSTQSFNEEKAFESHNLPIGPYADGVISTLVAEGPYVRAVWQINTPGVGTVGITDTLRQQIEAQGFELLYECQTDGCGGFDFRVTTEVVSEPDMHVDLGDFRFLSAQRLGRAMPEYLSVLISRSGDLAFVQLTHIGGAGSDAIEVNEAAPDVRNVNYSPVAAQPAPETLIEDLTLTGAAPLDDLVFATGSSDLQAGSFPSLDALSAYLRENPDAEIVLVGHTDAIGSLEANIALSKRRAESVLRRLVDDYLVPRSQVSADGIGYLAPRAGNETEQGRAANRRVEAVLKVRR